MSDRIVTKLSPLSVEDTVARISAILAEGGIKLFAVIDHSGEAAANGLDCATPRSRSSATRKQERR